MDAVRVDMLDRHRLAAGLIDGEYRDRVLAAREYLLAVLLDGAARPVRDINEPPVRMHMHGSDELMAADIVRFQPERFPETPGLAPAARYHA